MTVTELMKCNHTTTTYIDKEFSLRVTSNLHSIKLGNAFEVF